VFIFIYFVHGLDSEQISRVNIYMSHLESLLIGNDPQIVLLHEGLGSVSTWGNFPHLLHDATGLGVFVYSRYGYGKSSPKPLPWSLNYFEEEADFLSELLPKIGFKQGYIFGHSDGASITSVYMGKYKDSRVKGLTLIAPHFFTEEYSLKSIRDAKTAYETGELKAKLARHHQHVDNAFYGWNNSWLHDEFKNMNIEQYLPHIPCPVHVIQGLQDQYGTLKQVESAVKHCKNVTTTLLENCGHNPMREQTEQTLKALCRFQSAT
jgi:pimeloyl-ACP methyl ester carboxylesterase